LWIDARIAERISFAAKRWCRYPREKPPAQAAQSQEVSIG
jgi:hypothetical protein